MIHLLLVEDDPSLGETLCSRLTKEGYQVHWFTTFQEALEATKRNSYHLALLDVGLPDGDGFSLAREIQEHQQIPFLFLTAMNSAEYRLEGFEIGASDYIPKPFHLKELLLRLRHIIEKNHIGERAEAKDFSIDLSSMSLSFHDGTTAHPLEKDLRLLKHLIDSAPRIVSRDEILSDIWKSGNTGSHRSVDNAIVRIRQLLESKCEQKIRSVRGVGYQWGN